ncbi:NmrA/HSCARG family protein [Streptomyces sp. NPDC059567]|uniref:NmrA/HSCARG family protein n=1 Tax=Streptomyces sp. NPDC059567 TaxID=3346867 RepID=UPI0036C8C070
MAEKRVVTVFGATGRQGGSLARAILGKGEGDFAVRAVTRHPELEPAIELRRIGAEVVRADMDDEESLRPVFEGAYGAYLVTDFWEGMNAEHEKAQAEALARAAGHAGVQHAVWSTLEDTRDCIPRDDTRMPTLQGSYKVPHFDAKAEADVYFAEAGVPTTYLRTTFYWENLFDTFAPQRADDGVLVLNFPMGESRLSGISFVDIGRTALAVLERGTDLIGATVSIAGEHLKVGAMAAELTEQVGVPIAYRPLTPEAYRAQGFPGADEVGNMFQFYRDCEEHFTAARDLTAVRALNPGLQDFRTWLSSHHTKIPRS